MRSTQEIDHTLSKIVEDLKGRGRAVPMTVDAIPRLPFSNYAEIQTAVTAGRVQINRFKFEYLPFVVAQFGSSAERTIERTYTYCMFLMPLLSLVLTFMYSWVFLFGIFSIFFFMSRAKALYNSTVFSAALSSELAFCFLYYIGQISLTCPYANEIFYWTQEDRTSFEAALNPQTS